MLVKTEGIVLKVTKFKETSLIVKTYTPDHGVLSFLIKGVRTSKNTNKAVLFQPLNFLDLIVYYRENKSLLYLKEYKFNVLYQDIPFNVIKSSVAIFMLEVLEHVLTEDENEELYDFIKSSFLQLDGRQENIANFHLKFLIELMYYLGIQAQGKYSHETPFFNLKEGFFTSELKNNQIMNNELSLIFSKILNKEKVNLSKGNRKELLGEILLYYKIHLDDFREIKSLHVLESVLS